MLQCLAYLMARQPMCFASARRVLAEVLQIPMKIALTIHYSRDCSWILASPRLLQRPYSILDLDLEALSGLFGNMIIASQLNFPAQQGRRWGVQDNQGVHLCRYFRADEQHGTRIAQRRGTLFYVDLLANLVSPRPSRKRRARSGCLFPTVYAVNWSLIKETTTPVEVYSSKSWVETIRHCGGELYTVRIARPSHAREDSCRSLEQNQGLSCFDLHQIIGSVQTWLHRRSWLNSATLKGRIRLPRRETSSSAWIVPKRWRFTTRTVSWLSFTLMFQTTRKVRKLKFFWWIPPVYIQCHLI